MGLFSRYRTTSDQRWLELLTGAERSGNGFLGRTRRLLREGLGPALPKLPDDQLQKNFVGSSGANALREGFQFYQAIKRRCSEFGRPISPDRRILDFGCGWGRITRFFLKEVQAENLVGVDVDPDIIQICKETIGEGQYQTVSSHPPSHFPDRSFDVIFAYSVFSHLA